MPVDEVARRIRAARQARLPTALEVIRRRAGLGQLDVAEACGIAQATVSHLENRRPGGLRLSTSSLPKIHQALIELGVEKVANLEPQDLIECWDDVRARFEGEDGS